MPITIAYETAQFDSNMWKNSPTHTLYPKEFV